MSLGKRPSFQWYPGDWQRDTALRACSLEARGLWIEMLNLMHDGVPYGYLMTGGAALDATSLGRMVGVSARRCATLLAELGTHQVFSRTDSGVIFSRRMVRDEHNRNVRAAGGKLGGNPALMVKPEDNLSPTIPLTPAVAVASSSSLQTTSASSPDATELIGLLGGSEQAQSEVRTFLHGIPDATRRLSWLRNLTTSLQGIGAPPIAPAVMLSALADFNMADRERSPYSGAVFRAFIDRAARPKLEPTGRKSTVTGDDLARSAVSTIRALIQRNGPSSFIPKESVAALGPDVLAAYNAVGGADRFLKLEPDKIDWLVKAFAEALRAPGVTHAA